MRIERRNKVLEPNVWSDNDSSEGESTIFASREREVLLLESLKDMIDKKSEGDGIFHSLKGVDAQTQKLMLQVFRLEQPLSRARVSVDPSASFNKTRLIEKAEADRSLDADITGVRLSQGRGSVEIF